jgi:hypothetical protein
VIAVTARLTWDKPGTATITRVDGEKVELVSSIPFAPGSRPEATLAPGGQRIWIKIHGSHRLPDGNFQVAGRLINATRDLRAVLERALEESAP